MPETPPTPEQKILSDNAQAVTDAQGTRASTMPVPDYNSQLKPAAAWKTGLTKTFSVAGILFSSVVTALGVAVLVKGPKVTIDDGTMGKALKKILRVGGIGSTAMGITGLASSASVLSTANAATRARNFSDLYSQLNAKQQIERS